jgi:hypothetical protein
MSGPNRCAKRNIFLPRTVNKFMDEHSKNKAVALLSCLLRRRVLVALLPYKLALKFCASSFQPPTVQAGVQQACP